MDEREIFPFGPPETVIEIWDVEELTGVIMVGPMGNLNGYIVLPSFHARFGRPRDMFSDIVVHGSVTYAGPPLIDTEVDVDLEGWWVGFDHAHFGDDVIPLLSSFKLQDAFPSLYSSSVLADPEQVHAEVQSLALQLLLEAPQGLEEGGIDALRELEEEDVENPF